MITIARVRRAGVALGAALAVALLPAITASAHVTVSSPDATPGGFGKLVFRVPSESDTANTTAVSVQLPADTPFRFVSVRPASGWTVEAVTTDLPEPIEGDGFTLTEAVTTVNWTADDGGGLAPGEFTEFELSVGPFPDDVDQLVLPATQTYSDGEVVEWNQPTVEGEEEPEHPAPVLELAATTDDGGDDGGSDTDWVARALGAAGVALAVIGLALGRRTRPRPTEA